MSCRVIRIYQKLYSHYGPQHWWPAESLFEVIVGAILVQNTSWGNAEKAIGQLKKNRVLTAAALARLPERKLAALIWASGYYNVKAKRLKNFLKFFISEYNGFMGKMKLKETSGLRRQLLGINGIGQETADSILLYALDKPVFVVDAYTLRIFSRHALIRENASYECAQGLFMRSLPGDVKLFNEYHALIVRTAKEFCLKNKPKCDLCPLKGVS